MFKYEVLLSRFFLCLCNLSLKYPFAYVFSSENRANEMMTILITMIAISFSFFFEKSSFLNKECKICLSILLSSLGV